MNIILKQYKNVESRILSSLRGPLTCESLTKMLSETRHVANVILAETPEDIQEKIVSQARAYIAPIDLNGITLTSRIVIKSLAVSALLDEYLMTLTSLPRLKVTFWNDLEKDGLNFHIWSSIERAMHDRE